MTSKGGAKHRRICKAAVQKQVKIIKFYKQDQRAKQK